MVGFRSIPPPSGSTTPAAPADGAPAPNEIKKTKKKATDETAPPPPKPKEAKKGPPQLPATQAKKAATPATQLSDTLFGLDLSLTADQTLQRIVSDADHPYHAELVALLGDSQFSALPAPTRADILLFLVTLSESHGPARSLDLGELIGHDGFTALDSHDQRLVLEVYAVAGPETLQLLDHPALLTSKDRSGTRLLDDLCDMATAPLSDTLTSRGLTRQTLVRDTLREILDPEIVRGTADGQLTAASMQYVLVSEHPADYIRLLTSLTSAGSAEMAGGARLVTVPDVVVRRDDDSVQAVSGRLFQAALIEYTNGADQYDYRKNEREHRAFGFTEHWDVSPTSPENAQRVMEQLFGAHDKHDVDELKSQDLPKWVAVRWHTHYHLIKVVKIDDERAYFVDPWDPEPKRKNGESLAYLIRMEDNSKNLVSIGLSPFYHGFGPVLANAKS